MMITNKDLPRDFPAKFYLGFTFECIFKPDFSMTVFFLL